MSPPPAIHEWFPLKKSLIYLLLYGLNSIDFSPLLCKHTHLLLLALQFSALGGVYSLPRWVTIHIRGSVYKFVLMIPFILVSSNITFSVAVRNVFSTDWIRLSSSFFFKVQTSELYKNVGRDVTWKNLIIVSLLVLVSSVVNMVALISLNLAILLFRSLLSLHITLQPSYWTSVIVNCYNTMLIVIVAIYYNFQTYGI